MSPPSTAVAPAVVGGGGGVEAASCTSIAQKV